jgi:PKHD-type hydroxylase
MNQWWQFWQGRLSPQDCDNFIAMAKTLPPIDASIGHGSNEQVQNQEYRSSTVRWVPIYDPRFASVVHDIGYMFHESNKHAFGFDLTKFYELQFTEYHASKKGKYDWHHDTVWTGPSLIRRKLSMVIQLSDSDDYQGGDFEMYQEDCGIVPDKEAIRHRGTVIIFPSFLRHRVTQVTSGTRYSLVCWHEGPYFR